MGDYAEITTGRVRYLRIQCSKWLVQTEYLNRLGDAVMSVVDEIDAQIGFEVTVKVDAAPDRDDILNLFIVNQVPLPKEAFLTSEDGNDGEIPF
jgi:hypothetical protein